MLSMRQESLFSNVINQSKLDVAKYRAIDLFAGIGGIRLGFQQAFKEDIEFVFSSEIDKYACQTYSANFGDVPYGDITKIHESDIPKHDILLAGFPCQAFSIAGKRLGFEDTRGTLFFEVARVIKYHKPKVVFLENVKGFINHDKGKTFGVVKETLKELGYKIFYKVLNAKDYGVPQNRERIYIVGFLDHDVAFEFPEPLNIDVTVGDILEQEVDQKYYLSQKYLDTLKKHKQRHQDKGNGFGYNVLDKNGVSNTIVVGGMGKERNLIRDILTHSANDEGIRVLTPQEFAKLQGFNSHYKIPVSNTQAYKQFGNSVAVPVVENIAQKIQNHIRIKYEI